MKQKQTARYKSLPKYKGIRKDLKNGKYLVNKLIDGKRYSAYFDTIQEAQKWRRSFHPLLGYQEKTENIIFNTQIKTPTNFVLNGNDFGYTFSDVWKLYNLQYLPTLEKSTVETILNVSKFFDEIMNKKMVNLNSFYFDNYVVSKKQDILKIGYKRRYSFNKELKCLKAIFNWYKENYDGQFVNPILKRHRVLGKIKDKPEICKKLSKDELISFFYSFDDLFWRDFAETQFYLASRVGEIAGLQLDSINFIDRSIQIKNVVVWSSKDKKFNYLKSKPKNGEIRYVYMNDRLLDILQRRVNANNKRDCLFKNSSTGLPLQFVFNISGQPMSYRQIQYFYNKALKKAKLGHKFSSTHIMRHTMATIARKVSNLDGAQSVTGHKDIRMLQMYASLPEEANIETLKLVESYIMK